jgi:Amt family ammonium transporter
MSNSSGILPLNSGDNAWMMTSSALVLLMTPALAFFYGGLVDHKNVLNQIFLSFICMGIVLVQWVLFGFSFAFGPPVSEGFGSFQWAVLRFGEGNNAAYSSTFPLLTYCLFQATFAVITPAIISGKDTFWIFILLFLFFRS